MFDAFVEGLLINLQLWPFIYMLIGAAIGFCVGILPGLGGGTTLCLMLPFIYTMTPQEALPFLLGMHSVCATTGDITSVLFGIPGEVVCVATILDGYPMTKKGEAGRALGAALMSSLVGAIIGAGFMAITIPIVRPLVLACGSPEMFMLILLGFTCIATLSGHGKRGLLLGLLSGILGFMCSLVGQDKQGGILRFTFSLVYLWEGLPVVPVVIGLFAIPEVVDLAVRGTGIASEAPLGKLGKGAREGIKDTFRYFGLTIRCSIIGAISGMIPGLGGGISQWFAYAHAQGSARNEEERAGFGKGDVRGVLGPGACNNSKEGANLIPTIAFGVPAGTGMAILLGGFLLMGLVPGPDMLSKHLALTYSMVWTIVIANIFAVAASLLLINHLAKLTLIRGHLMIPVILLFCFIGAYMSSETIGDIIVMLIFGVLGCFMLRCRWPRPPFILGFILGKLAEKYVYISTMRFGLSWLYRPKVIILFLIIVAFCLYPYVQIKLRGEKFGEPDKI
jgi:putative tricarboxylic transport membrane protein